LLHVLPKGFVRIRYHGFLANRHRREQLALARNLLQAPPPLHANEPAPPPPPPCPRCRQGHMLLIETLEPQPLALVMVFDSS
jgi:hypothetical protein